MRFVKRYSLEIHTVISLALITFFAIWVQPDTAQRIILVGDGDPLYRELEPLA